MNKKRLLAALLILTATFSAYSEEDSHRLFSISPVFGYGQLVDVGFAFYPFSESWYILAGIGYSPLSTDFKLAAGTASFETGFTLFLDKKHKFKINIGLKGTIELFHLYNFKIEKSTYEGEPLGPFVTIDGLFFIGFEWEFINNISVFFSGALSARTIAEFLPANPVLLGIGMKFFIG